MQKKHLIKFNIIYVKNSQQSIKGTCLNIIKTTYDKPTANITLSGKKLKAIPLQSHAKMPLLPVLLNTTLEILTRTVREEKEIKGIQTRKEGFTLSLLSWFRR